MRDVLLKSLQSARPVYHAVPDWLRGDGCRGDEIVCNTHVYAGSDRVFGSNTGVALPDRVVAPCGLIVYRRKPIIERVSDGVVGDILNESRMVLQGTLIPKRHAAKFAQPCGKCFP